jgi:hypothetical protein
LTKVAISSLGNTGIWSDLVVAWVDVQAVCSGSRSATRRFNDAATRNISQGDLNSLRVKWSCLWTHRHCSSHSLIVTHPCSFRFSIIRYLPSFWSLHQYPKLARENYPIIYGTRSTSHDCMEHSSLLLPEPGFNLSLLRLS